LDRDGVRGKHDWCDQVARRPVLAALCVPVLDPEQQPVLARQRSGSSTRSSFAMAERLRRGELPLWDRWTSPASPCSAAHPWPLHPATLLYLALPFPLAFS